MSSSIRSKAAALLIGLTYTASASPVLWVDDENGMIGKVDIATGDVTLVGSAGVILTDIAFDPSGGLWGITGTSLYRIDKATGAASEVGALGRFGVLNSLVFGTDGVLYAANNQLLTIDTTTGRASPVGPIGFSSDGDLAFLDGTLYLAATGGQLAKVNTSTGTGTFVGAMGINRVFGLAATNDGTLLAGAGDGIYRVDPATGASTLLFSLAGQGLGSVYGAAFFDEPNELRPPRTEVPEPASQLLTGVLVFVFAGQASRWRSRRTSDQRLGPNPAYHLQHSNRSRHSG